MQDTYDGRSTHPRTAWSRLEGIRPGGLAYFALAAEHRASAGGGGAPESLNVRLAGAAQQEPGGGWKPPHNSLGCIIP